MPCLLLILVLAFPRIVLVLIFLFSNYLTRAYHGLILPLLGFIFVPLTTLAYAWMVNTGQPIAGVNLLILLVAIVIDLGGLGGGEYHRPQPLSGTATVSERYPQLVERSCGSAHTVCLWPSSNHSSLRTATVSER